MSDKYKPSIRFSGAGLVEKTTATYGYIYIERERRKCVYKAGP